MERLNPRGSEPDAAHEENMDRIRLGRLEDALGFNLRLAQEASFRAFAQRVGDPELKPRRYAILQLIAENPGLTQAELGRASGRDKSTITPALRDLLRRKLVKRSADPGDRRVYVLQLTEKGEGLLRTLSKAASEHDELIEAGIGKENRGAFLQFLRGVTAIAQAFVRNGNGPANGKRRKKP